MQIVLMAMNVDIRRVAEPWPMREEHAHPLEVNQKLRADRHETDLHIGGVRQAVVVALDENPAARQIGKTLQGFFSPRDVTQMYDSILRLHPRPPRAENKLLKVLRSVAKPNDILMPDMRIGNQVIHNDFLR